MQIHVVADFVCPWCYIGKRQFEHALSEREELNPEVHWLPFQLNPDMPEEGMDRDQYLADKFGEEGAHEMDQRLRAYAEELGLEMRLERVGHVPNTVAAHTLAMWADEAGKQHEVVDALFRAYFVEGADIGDTDTLCRVAEEADMDPEIVRAKLESGEDRDKVLAEDQMLRQVGIQAVPCTIVEKQFIVSGAGGKDAFHDVFDQALAAEDDAATEE